jgi:glycerol-3-phosphate dehydrogenase subunit C
MFKFEWPLILPDDPAVKKLAAATFDVSEYLVDIARKDGLALGLGPLVGGVTVQLACHARAQNMGQKAAEMLRLLPDTKISVIERCSGHGGSWGVLKENFDTALKVGKPVARQALRNATPFLSSECPLAAMHIAQGMEIEAGGETCRIPQCTRSSCSPALMALRVRGRMRTRGEDDRVLCPGEAPADRRRHSAARTV